MSRAKRALFRLVVTLGAACITVAIGGGIFWVIATYITVLVTPLIIFYALLFFFLIFYMGSE